jgi:ankyrin repeat protein
VKLVVVVKRTSASARFASSYGNVRERLPESSLEGKVDRMTEICVTTTNLSGKKDSTALIMAAVGGWNEIAKIPLESGADADKAATDGMTPLCIACQEGHWRL